MKAVVLLSGGIDSATCLGHAVEQCGTENVAALNIIYGQKHSKEAIYARKIAQYYVVPLYEQNLSQVMSLSKCPLLTNSGKDIKHESYAEQLAAMGGEGTVDTYVPFRNGLLISAAAAYALSIFEESGDKDIRIYYGAHKDDAAGRAYPDCTPEFVYAMNQAVHGGSGGLLTLMSPLISMNKAEIVKWGLEMKVPYHMTWSCYEGGEEPCGTCGTCIDRKAAFAANGVEDPYNG